MSKKLLIQALIASGMMLGSMTAHSLPALQMTILNGTYHSTGTANYDLETTVAGGNIFTLYALLDDSALLAHTFKISAALWPAPPQTPVPTDGSFKFDASTISVASGMTWGMPSELSSHGVFDTYYKTFDFNFVSTNKTAEFDAQTTTPTSALASGCTSNCMYFAAFTVDVTNLSSSNSIHFDLYDTQSKANAPYSHDAQSGNGGSSSTSSSGGASGNVPEPGSSGLALLGMGLLGAMLWKRHRSQNA